MYHCPISFLLRSLHYTKKDTTKITNDKRRNKIHRNTNLDSWQSKKKIERNDAKDFPKSFLLHNLVIESRPMSILFLRPIEIFFMLLGCYLIDIDQNLKKRKKSRTDYPDLHERRTVFQLYCLYALTSFIFNSFL